MDSYITLISHQPCIQSTSAHIILKYHPTTYSLTFKHKIVYAFLILARRAIVSTHLISLNLIMLLISDEDINYEAPHYETISSPLIHLSYLWTTKIT
jgi:hypothetical protein